MIFQDPMMTLNPTLRIDRQMIEAVQAHSSTDTGTARRRAAECLTAMGITAVEQRLRSYPHQLSGGMRQRVAIAIALLNEPDVIIADEPTTALDVTIQAQILSEIQKLCARTRTAILWISHDLSVVAGLASRICVLYGGKDVEQGDADRILDDPVHPYTQGLLASVPGRGPRGGKLAQIPGTPPSLLAAPPGCAFAPRCPRAAEICASPVPVTPNGPRDSFRCFRPDAEPAFDFSSGGATAAAPGAGSGRQEAGAPILVVRNVVKDYGARPSLVERAFGALGLGAPAGSVKAVNAVSFEVRAGEIVGLVGESGCGKSTLARMIAGIEAPTSGTIDYAGRPLTSLRTGTKSAADLGIQMIFQNPFASLNPRMNVGEIIGGAVREKNLVPRGELEDYVADLMRRCGLDPDFRNRLPHQFSGGQRQRIGIARALAVRPKVLVCDEAIAALDVSIQAQIINLFIELRESFDLTYLFISHDLSVIRHLCDRVLIMYLGRVVEEARAAELFARPRHHYSNALISEIPDLSRRRVAYEPVKGEIPSPISPPAGCHFHPRCQRADATCSSVVPVLSGPAGGHRFACHHPLS
jgi:peptide/nickel transport system ATP-binding protein